MSKVGGLRTSDDFGGSLRRSVAEELGGIRLMGHWHLVHRDAEGRIKGEDDWHNIVTTAGINHALATELAAGTQVTAWYVGLKGAGAVAAGNTLASHSPWSELNPYTGNRKAWTPGSVSAGSVDNSASKASFAITSSATVAGAFLASAASGTTGTLYAVGDFTAARDVVNGDTLDITATFTGADDGV